MEPFLRDFVWIPLYRKGMRELGNGNVEITLFVEKMIAPQQIVAPGEPYPTTVTPNPPVEFTVEVAASIVDRLNKPFPRDVEFTTSREQWQIDMQAAIEAYHRERREIFTAMASVIMDVYEQKMAQFRK